MMLDVSQISRGGLSPLKKLAHRISDATQFGDRC